MYLLICRCQRTNDTLMKTFYAGNDDAAERQSWQYLPAGYTWQCVARVVAN